MASTSRALTRLAGPQLGLRAAQRQLSAVPTVASIARLSTSSTRRSLLLASNLTSKTARPTLSLSRQARRAYADVAPVKKPRKFRYFRWAWRLTYLYVLGSIGYVIYDGYTSRHPDGQFTPDPSKKNLVILGKFGHQASQLTRLCCSVFSALVDVSTHVIDDLCTDVCHATKVPAGAPSRS